MPIVVASVVYEYLIALLRMSYLYLPAPHVKAHTCDKLHCCLLISSYFPLCLWYNDECRYSETQYRRFQLRIQIFLSSCTVKKYFAQFLDCSCFVIAWNIALQNVVKCTKSSLNLVSNILNWRVNTSQLLAINNFLPCQAHIFSRSL